MMRRLGLFIGGLLVALIIADLFGLGRETSGGIISLRTKALSEVKVDTQGGTPVVDNMGDRAVRNVEVLCTATDATGKVTSSSYQMLPNNIAARAKTPLTTSGGANDCAVIDLKISRGH